jgi:WD40 repeat protein
MKYSPDESMLAVGSHDNNIYVFKVSGNTYELHGVLQGHNSFITNLDWSRDGAHLQSNCGAYELLFWDVPQLKQMKSGAT